MDNLSSPPGDGDRYAAEACRVMKQAICCCAIAFCLAFEAGCQQSEDTDELSRALALVKSSRTSDRVHGFEQLGKLWDADPPSSSYGFSDTPVVKEPKSEKAPELPDDVVDRIAKAIQRGIEDKDPKVREAAAIALCSAPRAPPEVMTALTAGLNSKDAAVSWYVSQRAVETLPPIETVIESLIHKLSSDDFSNYWSASHILEAYGVKASPFADQIVDAVLQSKTARDSKMYVLYDVGLRVAAAKKLADAATDFTRDELGIAAVCLLDHPKLLKQIESHRPETIPALQEQMPRLYPFLCRLQSPANETRSWLAASEKLLPSTMGLLREERFIDKITIAETSATEYKKTLLAACKRACGADPGEQIMVDADHAVEFRPKSAWPNIDDGRRSKTAEGHGDGVTYVMVTGEVRGADGAHPASVKFFRTNDGMLLGTRQNIPADILYDSSTGRFVCYTSIFAAYSLEKDQPEPGPYQTGSAQIRVEAEGYHSLTLQFFDEMPDVVITLSPRAGN